MKHLDPIYKQGIQKALNEHVGHRLLVDGVFGPKTQAALKMFQEKKDIPATGWYDDQTKEIMDPIIKAKYLTMDSIKTAAEMLGITPAHIRAICDVESKGAGFLPDGRCIILFERHKFYDQLRKKIGDSNLLMLSKNNSDIINRTPGGYAGYEKEYQRFDRAYAIDKESAIMATSWGLFQIMGFNYSVCGYSTVFDFHKDMIESETKQLSALVRFIRNYRKGFLKDALAMKMWASFAKMYNGPAYAKNSYDIRLQRSFEKYSKDINAT